LSTTYRKKLIEVALPLEAINKESAREKSIRHGHPSTLHLWWSRKPLATCRAVLFASLIDDPDQPGIPAELLDRIDRLPPPEKRGAEWERMSLGERRRQRLFAFIEKLVKWENSADEGTLKTARELIHAATGGNPPPVLDPFCGGGSIPLEAQRLGLEAHASDLNPVAVLITKALIEIPPKFASKPPVNPEDRPRGMGARWKGAAGLAADVRYYGRWMRVEAEKRIGHLYPKVKLPEEHGGGEATVIAWLWARTVKCPNPACGAQMPLTSKFWLSTKPGHKAWVEPVVDREAKTVRFEVKTSEEDPGGLAQQISAGTGCTNGQGRKVKATFRCAVCGNGVAKGDYVDAEANEGRMGAMPLAIVAEGGGKRVYVPFDHRHGEVVPSDVVRLFSSPSIQEELPREAARGTFASNAQGRIYGFKTFADYFTPRQLVALTTFSDLVGEAREKARRDAVAAGLPDDGLPLNDGGTGAQAYADAVATYLAFAADKAADYWSAICTWHSSGEKMRNTFGRQAIPMVWDYAECCPFSDSTGNWMACVDWVCKVLAALRPGAGARARQLDATTSPGSVLHPAISTDPPYYDNIGYADLSDFFYVWLRRSLNAIYPDLFATLLTPKAQELIASPYRFGGDGEKARAFFEAGLGQAFTRMRQAHHPSYPLTVYYAFKQAEEDSDEQAGAVNGTRAVASTGWETMLEGLLRAGFTITGTWPMRSELSNRPIASGTNALASSIVLVCRPRPTDAPLTNRREFVNALKRELPGALRTLQHGNIAPVDFAQAAIGPGMAVFSRYSKVLEADGSPMSVRTALALINQTLDEVLAEQEGEYDADTRWAVAWFEQFGHNEGPFGAAETLSKAKNTAINGLVEAGIVQARAGKVRLLRRDELPKDWNPTQDSRTTAWEVMQQLIRALETSETAAAELLLQVGGLGEVARDLAYRLYSTCERKKWSQEALAYNSLAIAWPALTRRAAEIQATTPSQARFG